jgi:hypothetical protein
MLTHKIFISGRQGNASVTTISLRIPEKKKTILKKQLSIAIASLALCAGVLPTDGNAEASYKPIIIVDKAPTAETAANTINCAEAMAAAEAAAAKETAQALKPEDKTAATTAAVNPCAALAPSAGTAQASIKPAGGASTSSSSSTQSVIIIQRRTDTPPTNDVRVPAPVTTPPTTTTTPAGTAPGATATNTTGGGLRFFNQPTGGPRIDIPGFGSAGGLCTKTRPGEKIHILFQARMDNSHLYENHCVSDNSVSVNPYYLFGADIQASLNLFLNMTDAQFVAAINQWHTYFQPRMYEKYPQFNNGQAFNAATWDGVFMMDIEEPFYMPGISAYLTPSGTDFTEQGKKIVDRTGLLACEMRRFYPNAKLAFYGVFGYSFRGYVEPKGIIAAKLAAARGMYKCADLLILNHYVAHGMDPVDAVWNPVTGSHGHGEVNGVGIQRYINNPMESLVEVTEYVNTLPENVRGSVKKPFPLLSMQNFNTGSAERYRCAPPAYLQAMVDKIRELGIKEYGFWHAAPPHFYNPPQPFNSPVAPVCGYSGTSTVNTLTMPDYFKYLFGDRN